VETVNKEVVVEVVVDEAAEDEDDDDDEKIPMILLCSYGRAKLWRLVELTNKL
jgi:hypothetical protein